MKLSVILLMGFAVFAAPCVYDSTSREPSALAGIVAPFSATKAVR